MLPYGIGIAIALGGFALYFWLSTPNNESINGEEAEPTLPGIYNSL